MIKKVIKNIDKMLLILILIASIITIRNLEQYKKLQIAINVIMIAYFIMRIIKKQPIKIIKSKIDIYVILLIISTLIPLISNTYISLFATVTAILEYVTLFWIYIMVREITVKSEKSVQTIYRVIIFGTIVLIFLGIENLTTNRIFEFFKIDFIINGESRLVSVFGNPNAFAGLIVFSYFLNIHRTINATSEIEKNRYSVINTILILGLILTYSKLMFLIFPCMLIVYMIGMKDKQKSIYIMQNTITSLIIAIIYSYLFNKFQMQENYIGILLITIFTLMISSIINILNDKITRYVGRMKIRTILVLTSVIVIIVGVVVKIELQKTKEFIVFSENASTNYNAKKIKNIKPKSKYTFRFDMNATMDLVQEKEKEEVFTINIIQRDNKNLEITNHEEKFGKFSGIKEIEIETTENTTEIKIEFKSKYQYAPKNWVINHLKMNDEEIILEYKHLPTKLVEKIQDISIQYKTAQERFEFIRDGFKIISQNWLTGIGGEGWHYKYEEVQEYGYISNDTHSYFTQVWIEFGLCGIVALIGIISIVIMQKDERYRGIKFAILALLAHCMIDSDMYFSSMKVVIFFSLGILASAKKSENTNCCGNKQYWINGVLTIIPIITIFMYFNTKIYQKTIKINELETQKIGLYIDSQEYKELNKNLVAAYDEAIKYERNLSKINEYEAKKMQSYIMSGQDNLEEMVKQYYETMLRNQNKCKYNTKRIIEKSSSINNVIRMLENQGEPQLYQWIIKLTNINLNEFEDAKKQIEIAIQANYGKFEEERDYQIFLDNYQYNLSVYEKYYLGIAVNNTTQTDIAKKFSNDYKLQLDNKQDIILYHTHTTEGYNSYDGSYEEIEEAKTLNENYNMISIGKTLKDNLQAKNFNVTHIQEYHDLEGIDGAYTRSEITLKNKLKEQNKTVDIVFDLHRDAYMENKPTQNSVEIDGQNVANLRFVIAIGHEGWENNLKWAVELQKKADKLYPGLFKPMYIYDKNYNQSCAKCATLVEVGNNANTVEEAQRSMRYFSEIILKVDA